MSNAVVEMLFSEIVTEVRLSAAEDAAAGVNMPDLTIVAISNGVRLTPDRVRELCEVYRQAHDEASGGAS